ncbi:MAG: rubredoxin [Coriobacteriia bacterium]|nr:rubredoxin [Coriobacteriia bacterium]
MYKCNLCGWVYNEEEQGQKFEDLPEDWTCPMCGAPKSEFTKID